MLFSNRGVNDERFSPMAGKHKSVPEGTFYRDLGRTIRLTRVAAGKSQIDAAEHIDVSFQQLQKYESGDNRIPVDCLVSIAQYLKVPISHFVTLQGRSKEDAALLSTLDKFHAKEFVALVEAWSAIKDKQARGALLNLARCMAGLNR
jgi:transcriptional regulator with XRE-family HTH domain